MAKAQESAELVRGESRVELQLNSDVLAYCGDRLSQLEDGVVWLALLGFDRPAGAFAEHSLDVETAFLLTEVCRAPRILSGRASRPLPTLMRMPVMTKLPFTDRPGPLPLSLASGNASMRIAVSLGRSVRN